MENVCVIGLGNVGNPTAEHIYKYYSVYGYDIDSQKIQNRPYYATTNWDIIQNIDIFIVCVNTQWNGGPDMSIIETVMKSIKEKSTPQTLVIIESTVSVATSRKVFEEIFDKQVLLACCPHRLWVGDLKNYGVVQKRILGAVNDKSLEKSKEFYQSVKIPIHVVSKIEVAEMSKLVENSYRFVQIAFAEEMKIICDEHNLNFDEIRKACNTKWNIDLLKALDGIGGECLPKDIRILNSSSLYTSLLEGAIRADSYYRRSLSNA